MTHRVRCAIGSLCFLSAVTPTAWAQTTIQQADLEAMFSAGTILSFYGDTSGVQTANVGTKGGPQIFDFSSMQTTLLTEDTVYAAGSRPLLASRYPSSGIAFDIPSENGYEAMVFTFADQKLNNIGQFRQFAGDTIRYRHAVPAETFMSFPMNLDDSLTYSFTNYDTTFATPAYVDPNVSGPITFTNVVDAYGTLKLPGNIEIPCLRMRSYEDQPYNFKGFRFVTASGILLLVESRNNQPDTGAVTLDEPVIFITNGSVTSVHASADVPKDFALEQNFPNPFNPATVIRYQLASRSQVHLSIYDILGRQVDILVQTEMPAGRHSVEWNARVPSGIYFCRLEAVSASGTRILQTRKMIVLK